MATTTNSTKVTKAQRYADIKALLSGEAVQYDTTIDTALEFIDHEIALLANKNRSTSKKETETQKQNAVFMERIKAFLATVDGGMKCSEIRRNVEGLDAFDTPKTTALVGKLVKAGEVVRVEKKGVAYFSLPED